MTIINKMDQLQAFRADATTPFQVKNSIQYVNFEKPTLPIDFSTHTWTFPKNTLRPWEGGWTNDPYVLILKNVGQTPIVSVIGQITANEPNGPFAIYGCQTSSRNPWNIPISYTADIYKLKSDNSVSGLSTVNDSGQFDLKTIANFLPLNPGEGLVISLENFRNVLVNDYTYWAQKYSCDDYNPVQIIFSLLKASSGGPGPSPSPGPSPEPTPPSPSPSDVTTRIDWKRVLIVVGSTIGGMILLAVVYSLWKNSRSTKAE